ncbi:MAG: DUF2341 domain-containing protein, partial [archaeon]
QNISNWDTSSVTTMDSMFNGATNFNQNLTNWNVSKVTDMDFMFYSATVFNGNISNWNTLKVRYMGYMFYDADAFNQSLNSWNTSTVTDMPSMFYGTSNFNQPLGNWDTSRVVYMTSMFRGATSFNQDLSNWNTSSVNSMIAVFRWASNFNQNISSWNTSSVATMNDMFYGATSFNQDISNWDVSKVTDMDEMFRWADKFNQNLSNWNVSKVTDMTNMFLGVALSTANYDSLLNGWASLTPNLQSAVTFDGGNSQYSMVANDSRNGTLIGVHSWVITDGGVETISPSVTINTPLNQTYVYGTTSVVVNISLDEEGYCEYSFDGGVTNNTMTADGSNIVFNATHTGLYAGSWTVNAYCNDSSGNNNYTESVSFTINATPEISLDLIYPTGNINVTQNEFFNVTVNVTCNNADCGEINVSLDPYSSWTYKKEITIDYSKVNGSQVNFPVLINTTDSDLITKAQADGDDIVFADSNDDKLDHEIEYYNSTTGWLVAWVRIPTLSNTTNTTISMYYGNAGATNQENATGVWDSNFVMVQHMQEDPGPGGAGDIVDSTKYDNDGTAEASMTADDQVAGQIDGSLDFDGVDDYIGVPDDICDVSSDFSVTLWVDPDDNSENPRWTSIYNTGSNDFQGGHLASDEIYFRLLGSVIKTSPYVVSYPGWIYVVFVYNGGTKRIYVDGVEKTTISGGITADATFSAIGAGYSVNTYTADGLIDEVRISNVARSTGWIATEYNNQFSPDSFYSVGEEEQEVESKTGLINDTIGATPFYTNQSNPRTISLSEGESQLVTFWVNATGSVDTTHVFFAFANLTSDMSVSNITGEWNVTIVEANVAPNNPSLSLVSVDGLNLTMSDLNCSALITDDDSGDEMDVSVWWFKNGGLNMTLDYNNSYSNATVFSAILESGNTSAGENWTCGLRLYDGEEYSDWVNSSELEILNTLPTVTLDAPADGSTTTNRTPEFSWNGNDDDGDELTYEINITPYYGDNPSALDVRSEDGLDDSNYIPSSDLELLYDNGYHYRWKVRAHDGTGYGEWSSYFVVNISALIDILLTVDELNFGSLGYLEDNNSSDDSPPPFVIENTGTVLTNISINSSAIWSQAQTDSSYFQFKADNVSEEEGAFSWLSSITSWFNSPINSYVVVIDSLNYSDSKDSAEVDIRLEVPPNEEPGAKSSIIIFKAELSE